MRLMRSLSGRLLMVTIIAVMLVEVAIFVPSVARFRQDYLMERVRRAEIATLTKLAPDAPSFSPELEAALLKRAEVLNVVIRTEGTRQIVLSEPRIPRVTGTFDLRDPDILTLITDALGEITKSDGGIIRVRAFAPLEMDTEIEITLDSAALVAAMRAYGLNILWLSMIISVLTAIMVFLAVQRAVVLPITRVIGDVKRFSENPEDVNRIIVPGSTVGEIAEAEHAVADMQRDVHAALKARARLASLGEAVAKISHDLRNILGTTQLMADRIEMSRDPIVARAAPKLIGSLDRAIRLCQSTLAYGKAEEAPPETRMVALGELAEEVIEGQGLLPDDPTVAALVDIEAEIVVEADPEQLYRVLDNLVRNAVQAMRTSGKPGRLTVAADNTGERVEIRVIDTGPGLPARAREHLFKPFRGGTTREGTGLGLAIAQELVRANGGELSLVSSTTQGSEFRIALPSAAIEAVA